MAIRLSCTGDPVASRKFIFVIDHDHPRQHQDASLCSPNQAVLMTVYGCCLCHHDLAPSIRSRNTTKLSYTRILLSPKSLTSLVTQICRYLSCANYLSHTVQKLTYILTVKKEWFPLPSPNQVRLIIRLSAFPFLAPHRLTCVNQSYTCCSDKLLPL